MTNSSYCSMLHGGLQLSAKLGNIEAMQCCLRTDSVAIEPNTNYWNHPSFVEIRDANKRNEWSPDPGCNNCRTLEKNNMQSLRQGMNQGLELNEKTNLSGPARLDLMFDYSCNLACRTCSPYSSTMWQKHLKENGHWSAPIQVFSRHNDIIAMLSKLDLSNLRQVILCGGETLLGKAYWEVAAWLADNVPNAKQQLLLGFQTNGTQSIPEQYHSVIEKVNLVKLNVSIDGVGSRFDYLRWPATWDQLTSNLQQLQDTVPSNVMFLIEETVSIFNVYYINELERWAKDNFNTNREGDTINHTRHLAHGIYSLDDCLTNEYFEYLQNFNSPLKPVNLNWKENPSAIRLAIAEIKKIDGFRGESFEKTFPEVAEFYKRFL